MADTVNLQSILQALQNAVQAINNLNQTIAAVFPLATDAVAATANAGAGALPATPEAFLEITANGTQYKVPLYLP